MIKCSVFNGYWLSESFCFFVGGCLFLYGPLFFAGGLREVRAGADSNVCSLNIYFNLSSSFGIP